MKRTFSLVCVLLLCLGLFVGCSGDGDKKDTASTASQAGTTDGIFSTADVKYLDENNESVYRIIRPDGDENMTAQASFLFKQLKETLGVSIKNTSDAEDGTDAYEILLGETNRPETAQAKEYLIANVGGRVNDYIICTIGKKVVIYGMSQDALQAACEYFITNYVKPEGVKGGIKHTCATQGDFADASVNGVGIGRFVFVKQRYNESYITQHQLEKTIDQLIEKTGYGLSIVEDHNAAAEYEIIVGNADRDGVQKTENRDEYSIRISGKKVYLNGGSPAAKAMAISEFEKMLLSGDVTDAGSATGSYSSTVSSYDASDIYKATWSDDFDAPSDTHETGIDLTKWAFGTDGSLGHNGRQSVRSQSPDHLFVSDGMLNFYAAYDDERYYGFKIVTKYKMEFQYGVLEMSAILPHGDAFWIALWAGTLHENNATAFNPEINVVEMFGNSGSFASNMHGWLNSYQTEYYNSYWAPQGIAEHWSLDATHSKDKRYYCPEGVFNDGLHTFSYVWTEEMCGFACDGNLFFSIDPNEKQQWQETFSQPLYIILSQATCFASGSGKNMPDDAPEWTESNNFQIDYVHVYQKDDGKHTLTYFD